MFFSSKLGLSDVWQSIRRIVRILWVRVALISALSLAASLSAPLVEAFVPESWKQRFSEEATLPILNVLASSLLAVATFSLGIMVSSHRALAEQTTPRVHQILMEDTRTQTVIATFIGGFVYALSSIILFRAQVYGFDAAVVVFTTSSLVVLVIVLSLIRWIEHLSRIGSLTYALDQAEISAKRVLDELRLKPRYGGASCDAAKDKSADGEVIKAARCGYVLRFQMAGLQKQAQRDESRVIIDVMPGDHVLTGQQVARLIGGGDVARYREQIVIGGKRSHDQDPLYALQALRESGSKALSPGINDAGTATEVVTRLERLLWASFAPAEETPDVLFDRVHVREVAPGAMLTTSFRHIARDGKHLEEVVSYVARTVMRLSDRVKDDAAVDALLRDIDAYAKDGLITEGELRRYEDVRNP